jgi:hypothetical protein
MAPTLPRATAKAAVVTKDLRLTIRSIAFIPLNGQVPQGSGIDVPANNQF